MTNFSKPLTAIILSTAAFASIATANAAPSSNINLLKTIEFSQQDLASTEGLNTLHNRVVKAAEDICTPSGYSRFDVSIRKDIQTCVVDTVDQTFENTQVETLATYHQSLPKKAQHRKNYQVVTSN